MLDRARVVGTINEECIIRNLKSNVVEEKVRNVMVLPLLTVSEGNNVDSVRSFLEKSPGVLVTNGREVGA